MNSKKKKYKVVWTCDFCGKEFNTKKESDKHELECSRNPINENKKTEKIVTIIFIIFSCFYILTYLMVNSYAKANGFESKNLFSPSEWFSNREKEETTQEKNINMVSGDKMEINNTKYNGEIISGTILNKSDKPIFNTKIILKISKDRTTWNIDETHEFIVPYKIEPNQSINFSENYKTDKKDPWWTTQILESYFYNGEDIITPTPTKTSLKTTQNTENNTNSTTSSKPPLPVLSGANIFALINQYRSSQGLPFLSVSDELCNLAEKRADLMMVNNMEAFKNSSPGNHYQFNSVEYSGEGVGENIGANFAKDADVVNAWKQSPGHNALMLLTEKDGAIITKACVATRVSEVGSIVILLVGDK